MTTVWITQEMPRFNYTAAEEFGDLRFITASDLSTAPNSLCNRALIDDIKRAVSQYDPDTDILVPSGSPIVAMVVMAVLSTKTKTFRILKWDNRSYTYNLMEVEV